MPPRAAPLLLPCLILAGSRCDPQSQPLLGHPPLPRCRFFSRLADAKPQSALCAQWDPGNTAGPGLVKAGSHPPNAPAPARLFSAIQTDSPSGRSPLPVYASPLPVKRIPNKVGGAAEIGRIDRAELSESPEVTAMLTLTGCRVVPLWKNYTAENSNFLSLIGNNSVVFISVI